MKWDCSADCLPNGATIATTNVITARAKKEAQQLTATSPRINCALKRF
jgi:hypothetical protein